MKNGTFIILLCTHFACAQTVQFPTTLVKDWHAYSIPHNKDSLYAWNHDTTEWTMYSDNGNLYALNTYRAKYRRYLPGDTLPGVVSKKLWEADKKSVHRGRNILPVDDGYLIGINEGEWGGELLWYSKDGSEHYKISDDPVMQIIKKGNRIFAIQGISHLEISKGSIIEINRESFKWGTEEYLKLPTAPEAIVIGSNGNFVVLTSDKVIEITEDKRIIPLIEETQWWGLLIPQSLCIYKDIIYVGMRRGVYKFDLKTKEEAWLMRK